MNLAQFDVLAAQYMDMVFRLAFSHLKSKADADDVTQNVLLNLYRTDTVFSSNEHVKYWLVRVTLNECKKHWRSPWSQFEDFTAYAETLSFEEPEYGDLFQAIMRLDKKYRIPIVLHYCDGYSIAEISELLHVPVGTIGTRLARARTKLKLYLTEAYCDE